MGNKRSIKTLIWRGAVGGLFGGVVGQALLPKYEYGPGTKWTYFVISLALTVPIAAAIGAIIGAMIWGLHIWAKRNIGTPMRAIFGGVAVGVVSAFLSYGHYDDIQRSIVGLSYVRESTVLGFLVGLVAGIAAGSQNPKGTTSKTEPELLKDKSRSE